MISHTVSVCAGTSCTKSVMNTGNFFPGKMLFSKVCSSCKRIVLGDRNPFHKLQKTSLWKGSTASHSTVLGDSDSWFATENGKQYKTHRPTGCLQKGVLTLGSAFMALYDPYRHDMVAVLGETTGIMALKRLHRQMMNHPEGAEILRDKPRINSSTVDMDDLGRLQEGTLGREYHDFMTKNNITSDSRASVQYIDDADLAYVMQRYREVHDFYHCLLGMPTTMLGEVVVKWYETINTRLPMCALGALFGPVRLSSKRRQRLRGHYIPEVFRVAPGSELLLNCYFERRWEQPLDQVRHDMKMQVIPKPS